MALEFGKKRMCGERESITPGGLGGAFEWYQLTEGGSNGGIFFLIISERWREEH
jgi:hypothetical protein